MSKKVLQKIRNIALVVKNDDDAIKFYTEKLQFELVEDTDSGGGKRRAQVFPPNSNGTNLVRSKASKEEQATGGGNQRIAAMLLGISSPALNRRLMRMKAAEKEN